ncbi:unnamed protein product [Rodentolepis nana]|uniref:Uncharacterized protein n=1 Tax=Rodentolepis nana TaxID=102285 RepID=A0A0R3TPL9_RODNA|nr:unnamed protein product [Rodentolepis nana]
MPRQCREGRRWRRSWWYSCFGCTSHNHLEMEILQAIMQGDSEELEACLQRLQSSPISLTIRRDHPNKMFGTFFQQCSPSIFAVECCQWHLLPILSSYGFDFNRPQLCRRWTCFCRKQIRPSNSPYRRLWTKGQYTYQSILDYFFASIYETLGELEDTPLLLQESKFLENPLQTLLSRIDELLAFEIDVHRIDSIIVFNSLAGSFDRYLCTYFDPNDEILPDIPKRSDVYVELEALQRLIENGFSEFEFMEYVSSNTNWFGILISLLAHPRLRNLVEANRPVPPLIKSAAILLINLLVWRHKLPRASIDLQDCVNNLSLRKTYVRRYAEQRNLFDSRVAGIIRESDNLLRSPPCLGLIARNRIRCILGGKGFKAKVESLGLPQNLTTFLSGVGTEHMAWVRAPPFLVAVATGKLTAATFEDWERNWGVEIEKIVESDRIRTSLMPPPESFQTEEPIESKVDRSASFSEMINYGPSLIKRRASACPRISRLQPMTGPVLRIQRSMTAVVRGPRPRPRPSSAPLLKVTPPKVGAHRLQLPVR